MATILENIQKAGFLPTRPLRDDLPTTFQGWGGKEGEGHIMGLRKRLSSFSDKIQPISSAFAEWAIRHPGFTQIGEGSDGDDEDPDLDIDEEDKLEDDLDQDKNFLGEGTEPIDELDKANFSSGEPSGPPAHVEDLLEDVAAINQEDIDICSHMDYCSAQLRKFEMGDSEGEDEITMPEMVCVPEKMASNVGSAKRSLMESLEMAEMDRKLKRDSNKMKKWGHVLSTRPITRQHGNVNIMEKATAYLQKKNLEIS
ncbi:hypothetical protein D1007_60599 [Hordeum vulgare]|nr:hypothetical protein D1007_60599 [Hordeum vulgare]